MSNKAKKNKRKKNDRLLCSMTFTMLPQQVDRQVLEKSQFVCRPIYVHTDLQYLTALRGAVDVFAGLVHSKSDAVQQYHHDTNPLEPCEEAYVKANFQQQTHKRKNRLLHFLKKVLTCGKIATKMLGCTVLLKSLESVRFL